MIADSIIAHNIWFSKDKEIYRNYGLDPLIVSDTNKVNLNDRPLVFFLSLLDTIEHTKRFRQDPIEVLKSIDIIYQSERKQLVIKALEGLIGYNEYFNDLEKIEEWLKVKVERNDKDVIITIL